MQPLLETSREHRIRINDEISHGSNPRPAFFLMVALSSLIAAFGLVMNSTAVVIGAMLVAPLMTPILGVSLALVRGDPRLLGVALRAEAAGVAVALLGAMLLGLAIPFFESTPEMLSRTQPNLFDLMVAILAGSAGAYALVDEKLSPALPGVAISTAIVPPLANAGLSASLGAYQGAWGSFLLFFMNFLSVLLASAVVFAVSGLGGTVRGLSGAAFARRFGLAVIGLVVVSVLMVGELSDLIGGRQLQHQLRDILYAELPRYRVSKLEKLVHREHDDITLVLAHVHAPREISPRAVKGIELAMEEQLGRPFDLYVRTTLTKNVSATGSINQVVAETLDGFSLRSKSSERLEMLHAAEQVIREYLGDKMGQELRTLQSFPLGDDTVLLAEIRGPRRLRKEEAAELDELVANRLQSSRVQLKVIQWQPQLMSPSGVERLEFIPRHSLSEEQEELFASVEAFVGQRLTQTGHAIIGATLTELEDGYYGLFEVTGPGRIDASDVRRLESAIREQFGETFSLFLRRIPESVVTATGFTTWNQLLSEFGARTRAYYDDETRALIDAWR